MAFVTDGNRPQPLWQPPTACLTASGAASEVPSPPTASLPLPRAPPTHPAPCPSAVLRARPQPPGPRREDGHPRGLPLGVRASARRRPRAPPAPDLSPRAPATDPGGGGGGAAPDAPHDPLAALHDSEVAAFQAHMDDLVYQAYSHFLARGPGAPFRFGLAEGDAPWGFEEALRQAGVRRLGAGAFALDGAGGASAALQRLKAAAARGVGLLRRQRPEAARAIGEHGTSSTSLTIGNDNDSFDEGGAAIW